MMKKSLLTIFLITLIYTGYSQSKTYDLREFTHISIGGSSDLYLTQGNTQSVEIEADERDLDKLTVEVQGDRLVIKRDNSWSWNNSGKIKVYVTIPTVEGLSVSGSGGIYGKSVIRANDLDLSISGSGEIDVEVEARDMELSISGSGDCFLKGTADRMELTISGSGEVEGKDLTVDELRARISGSGEGSFTVNSKIDASISGSGTIYYSGNPSHVNSHASGSGKVKKM